MAYIISVMVSKIDKFNHDEVLSNDIFKEIVSLFLSSIEGSQKFEVNSLQELADIFNNVYVSIYNSNEQKSNEQKSEAKNESKKLT
jgi:hypothetical protein